ncbi:glycerol transporter [Streptomyces hygroscopicus subsp. limoneus]|nr:glycerol transporter [Streptomyces hygroscopicus subsp. limoneus]
MSNGDIFVGEVIGTAILILFGAGVCAAVTLRHSKARASGWIVIAFGWGFGVLAGAYTAAPLSGGRLNPAVTIGIAVDTGKWGKVWSAGHYGGTRRPPCGVFLDSSTTSEVFAMFKTRQCQQRS